MTHICVIRPQWDMILSHFHFGSQDFSLRYICCSMPSHNRHHNNIAHRRKWHCFCVMTGGFHSQNVDNAKHVSLCGVIIWVWGGKLHNNIGETDHIRSGISRIINATIIFAHKPVIPMHPRQDLITMGSSITLEKSNYYASCCSLAFISPGHRMKLGCNFG